jgi:hypothetical protein
MVNELQVMDRTGDSKTIWDPDKADEVAAARETYNKLKAKGYGAFRVDKKGEAGTRLDEFDPQAGAIIMIPRFAGG